MKCKFNKNHRYGVKVKDLMMETIYSKNTKYCSVCEGWNGQRKIDQSDSSRVRVSASSIKGKCTVVGSAWKNHDRLANATCNKWSKWNSLK